MQPSQPRRRFLQSTVSTGVLSVAVAAGLLKPAAAQAWLPFFNYQTPAQPASPSYYGGKPRARTPLQVLVEDLRKAKPEMSTAVDLLSPEVAVDGASIMLEFRALLPEVDGFAVFIEGNPRPLAAAFHLAPEVLPEMRLLVRLAQSSNVSIVARSQGRLYKTSKFVKVTQGGCSDSFTETQERHRGEVERRYRTAP